MSMTSIFVSLKKKMTSIFSSPSIRVHGGPKAESLSPRERAVSHPATCNKILSSFLNMLREKYNAKTYYNVFLYICSFFGQQAERERMVLDIKVKLQVISLIAIIPTPKRWVSCALARIKSLLSGYYKAIVDSGNYVHSWSMLQFHFFLKASY